MNRKTRKRSRGSPLLTLAVILLIAGVAAFFTPVLIVELELWLDAEAYGQLQKQSRISAIASDPAEFPDVLFPASFFPAGNTGVDLAVCKAENDDFIAWLQIPETTVDYPVVLTNNTKYYLEHTFSGKKSYLGTLLSLGKTDYSTPGSNIAIYGHHIRSNSQIMFSPLLSYKKQSFYEDHKSIYLDSLYHADTYIIFAVINMRNGDWDPSAASFASDEDFMGFIQRARSLSLYETSIEVTSQDQILTLITCDRSYIPTYGRLVIMAVRLQPNDRQPSNQ